MLLFNFALCPLLFGFSPGSRLLLFYFDSHDVPTFPSFIFSPIFVPCFVRFLLFSSFCLLRYLDAVEILLKVQKHKSKWSFPIFISIPPFFGPHNFRSKLFFNQWSFLSFYSIFIHPEKIITGYTRIRKFQTLVIILLANSSLSRSLKKKKKHLMEVHFHKDLSFMV